MSRDELEYFMIEYAMMCIEADGLFFKDFYKTDCFEIKYEMLADHGVAYIIEGGERREIATVYYKDVAAVVRNTPYFTEKVFNPLIEKYHLEAPQSDMQIIPNIVLESEENKCQETN